MFVTPCKNCKTTLLWVALPASRNGRKDPEGSYAECAETAEELRRLGNRSYGVSRPVPKWRFLSFGENFAFRGTERKTAVQWAFLKRYRPEGKRYSRVRGRVRFTLEFND